MSNKVGIVIDSAAAIPQALVKEYNIQIVPLLSIIEGKSYRDIADIKTPDELFQMVKKSSGFPTTSASPPTAYLEAYRQLSQRVNDILVITISSNLSMSFNSATQAKEMAKNELPALNIQVFDSRTTVGAYGFIALAAARAAASGQDITQIIEVASKIREKVNCIFMFDTLSYLARSGRRGRAAALAGNMLSMKTILDVPTSTGSVEPVTRVRTKARAIRRLLEIMGQRVGVTNSSLHVMVQHTCSLDEAERLKEIVLNQFNCAEILLCEFNPVASLITGPKMLGLSFYSDST